MEWIARFIHDDSATAESTSTIIMVAAVGLLLAAGLLVWFGRLYNVFDLAGSATHEFGKQHLLDKMKN